MAVYLNWEYVRTNSSDFAGANYLSTASSTAETTVNTTVVDTAQTQADVETTESTENYGEAYFAEAKLSRTKSRDEAIDALKYMLEDAELSTNEVRELTLEATNLAKCIEVEGKIENLIKAKGFSDCMVYYDSQKIDVMVQSDGLTDSEAAQIRDVILGEVEVSDEKISIIEIK